MNDEVKEILDDLLFTTTLPNVSVKLSEEKLYQLKDYITNLQEELEEQKRIEQASLDTINNLQEENERLKELCDKYEEEHNTAFKLWKMKMEEMPTYEEKETLKLKVEKAIEYIKVWQSFPHTNGSTHNELKNLLNILGGDEE